MVANKETDPKLRLFRHLLERDQLGAVQLQTINTHLAAPELRMQAATIVDASIIAAPASTKNRLQARDSELHRRTRATSGISG